MVIHRHIREQLGVEPGPGHPAYRRGRAGHPFRRRHEHEGHFGGRSLNAGRRSVEPKPGRRLSLTPGSSRSPSPRTMNMEADSPPVHLDTSVVVRYLTDDRPEMAARAALLIDSQTSLAITDLVIVSRGMS